MAIITMLTSGPVHTLESGVQYAMPGRAVYVYGEGAGTLQISNDGTTWGALGTLNPVVSAFIRSDGGNKVVTLKPV